MKVLHVQKVKGIGGSERHLLSLLPALGESGDEVRLLVLAAGEDEGGFVDAARERGIDTIVSAAGRDLDPRPVGAIVAQVRAFGPDLVHTHLIHGDVWGQTAAAVARVRAVRTFHNVQRSLTREPARTASRYAGRLAKRTMCISEHVAGFVREHHLSPPERIRMIPYGIELIQFPPEKRSEVRARWDIPEGAFVLAMASRLIEGKGHAMAIEAFELASDPPGMDLLIAGRGPLLERLQRANGDPRIRFIGQLDDVRTLLAASDALVFPTEPSLGEGFGLAALEAMSAGLPVIATRVGALPEVVEDGTTGMIVEPEPTALSGAIGALARDRDTRARMGAAGRARAADLFSLDSMVSKTREVYRDAVGR